MVINNSLNNVSNTLTLGAAAFGSQTIESSSFALVGPSVTQSFNIGAIGSPYFFEYTGFFTTFSNVGGNWITNTDGLSNGGAVIFAGYGSINPALYLGYIPTTGGSPQTVPFSSVDYVSVSSGGQLAATNIGARSLLTVNLASITNGSGPPSAVANQGSLYLNSTGSGATLAYLNTNGSNGWVPILTASSSIAVNVQTFTSSGTYTPTVGMAYCIIEVVGGGGGGGGVNSAPAANASVSAGGGAGGYARKTVAAGIIGVSQVVTIGAAGASGVNTGGNGGTGGTTSVGAIVSATGGIGGGFANATTLPTGTSGGAGGAGANGDFNTIGQPGGLAQTSFSSGIVLAGYGGSSFFGGGAFANGYANAGQNGQSYGGGGAGTGTYNGNPGTGLTGGSGAPGLVVVTEYIII